MTKRQSAKHKIDRRMGENIWGRPKSPVNKREYGPGQHGQRRKGKMSDFGIQLKAKQKLKGYYANISERQFSKVYEEASRMKGDTSENLIGLLERRLDAIDLPRQIRAHHVCGAPVREPRPCEGERPPRDHRFHASRPATPLSSRQSPRNFRSCLKHATGRARCSGLCGSRSQWQDWSRARFGRRSVSGSDGAALRGGILFALSGLLTKKAARKSDFLIERKLVKLRAPTPFSLSSACSSPVSTSRG